MTRQKKTLYVVANAHLDTQWNWTIQDTIRDCIKNTLDNNFALLEKYPGYRMNFEGAFRYQLAKEYYPEKYEKLKQYVAEGRWNVAGSSWDACDVNVPSSEALMRQILLGNGYFEREFGKTSTDIFLTDCFGFRYALPSIAAHMGLNGFSTQKLVWGAGAPIIHEDGSVTKPMPGSEYTRMDLGKWVGPDGNFVIGSLLEGDYTYNFDNQGNTTPINRRPEYLKAIEHNEKYAGTPKRSMYYGTGDYGGSCSESSARMVQEAVDHPESGLYDVVSASTDQIMNDLTAEEIDALPVYDGGLLIPHGSGAMTSRTINKRFNRKNELLADAAEKACVMGMLTGGTAYPAERLDTAWKTFLWHQFHDDLPGTSIASAYGFSHNDFVIALNLFASELTNGIGAVARGLDTDVKGTPVVVYNPVSDFRSDVVRAELPIQSPYVRVFDDKENEVPAQLSTIGGKTVVTFAAHVAPVSCTIFDVRESNDIGCKSALKVTTSTVENERFAVKLDANGDICSIFDKENSRELLSAPSRFTITQDNNTNWPAWEIKYEDLFLDPAYVAGTPEIEILDHGPAVVSLKVTRTFGPSTFTQVISLWQGGQRVDVDCDVNWHQRRSLLRVIFPLTVSNPLAAFDQGLGAVEGGSTMAYPYYQHNMHQWADQTDEDGSFGVTIMNDCKYGMEKPDDHSLRMTLIHTPLGQYRPASGQDWQDMGKNLFRYSFTSHAGTRRGTPSEAASVNQPLMSFTTSKHEGTGRDFSLLLTSDRDLIIRAVKKEEKGSRIIVRVQETAGIRHDNAFIRFVSDIAEAVETNGYEQETGAAQFDGRTLHFVMNKYGVKTFAVTLKACTIHSPAPDYASLPLPFTSKATSSNSDRASGEIAQGIAIPSELFQRAVAVGGVPFALGEKDESNMVICAGQTLRLPDTADKVYILAASTAGDKQAVFKVGDKSVKIGVQDFKDNVGSWDSLVAGTGCLIKQDEIAQVYTHTHAPEGDRLYLFAYLFKYGFDVTGKSDITLPLDPDIVVMAATARVNGQDAAVPAWPLYDRADGNTAPFHKLTTLDCSGQGLYREGTEVLVNTKAISEEGVFDGWEGDCLVYTEGPIALVRIGKTDTTVTARRMSLGNNLVCQKPCKASGCMNECEAPEMAVNGRLEDKWCASPDQEGICWLEVDIGEIKNIAKWCVCHAGVSESPRWNTRDFALQYRQSEKDDWKCADRVEANTESLTIRTFPPVHARYVRLWITRPTDDSDNHARIYQFQVFESIDSQMHQ